jgi:hypothetical protein
VAHVGLEDDMEEHWLYEGIYGALWQLGYHDVY